MSEKVVSSYYVKSENVKVKVEIKQIPDEFTLIYDLAFPKFDKATRALIDDIKNSIVASTPLPTGKLLDAKLILILKKEFRDKAEKILDKEIPDCLVPFKHLLAELLAFIREGYVPVRGVIHYAF